MAVEITFDTERSFRETLEILQNPEILEYIKRGFESHPMWVRIRGNRYFFDNEAQIHAQAESIEKALRIFYDAQPQVSNGLLR